MYNSFRSRWLKHIFQINEYIFSSQLNIEKFRWTDLNQNEYGTEVSSLVLKLINKLK